MAKEEKPGRMGYTGLFSRIGSGENWRGGAGHGMAMAVIWAVMVGASILCGAATGQGEAVASAALEGAQAGEG